MKTFAPLLALLLLPAVGRGEEILRWKDAAGTLHYSNQVETAPADAEVVTTRIVVEADRIPATQPDLVIDGDKVFDAAERVPAARPARARTHRIYTERRLRFGCYAGALLSAGGWAHADDVAATGNCLPYLLGPEAWLNAARAELALREHGIDWRQVVPMYLAQQRPHGERGGRLAAD